MFSEALLATAKIGKQPKYPLMSERKKCGIYAMQYYIAIKRTKSCHLQQTWMEKGYDAKWETSDKDRQKSYVITYSWNLKNKIDEQVKPNESRLLDTENRLRGTNFQVQKKSWNVQHGKYSQ